MAETEYRIDFTITRRAEGDEDFTDIGFGSSGAWHSIDAAVHDVESIVQNRMWETQSGMPDPAEIDLLAADSP